MSIMPQIQKVWRTKDRAGLAILILVILQLLVSMFLFVRFFAYASDMQALALGIFMMLSNLIVLIFLSKRLRDRV